MANEGGALVLRSAQSACSQLFTRRAARALYSNQRLQRWCFDVELIFLAQRLGIPIVETSVNWTEIPGAVCSEENVCNAVETLRHQLGLYVWQSLTWHAKQQCEDCPGSAFGDHQ